MQHQMMPGCGMSAISRRLITPCTQAAMHPKNGSSVMKVCHSQPLKRLRLKSSSRPAADKYRLRVDVRIDAEYEGVPDATATITTVGPGSGRWSYYYDGYKTVEVVGTVTS